MKKKTKKPKEITKAYLKETYLEKRKDMKERRLKQHAVDVVTGDVLKFPEYFSGGRVKKRNFFNKATDEQINRILAKCEAFYVLKLSDIEVSEKIGYSTTILQYFFNDEENAAFKVMKNRLKGCIDDKVRSMIVLEDVMTDVKTRLWYAERNLPEYKNKEVIEHTITNNLDEVKKEQLDNLRETFKREDVIEVKSQDDEA